MPADIGPTPARKEVHFSSPRLAKNDGGSNATDLRCDSPVNFVVSQSVIYIICIL
jgi:hypothetical protein